MVSSVNRIDLHGIGMTSQRTRERLIQRLVDQGVSDRAVLDVMRERRRTTRVPGWPAWAEGSANAKTKIPKTNPFNMVFVIVLPSLANF